MRAFILTCCLLALAACERNEPPPVQDQSVRPARVFQVSAEGGKVVHQFVGRVDAAQTVDLSFEVAGPLARLDVKEGQSVSPERWWRRWIRRISSLPCGKPRCS